MFCNLVANHAPKPIAKPAPGGIVLEDIPPLKYGQNDFLDDLFGRVLAALDRTGQAENTLVLYCSDHGDYCGEHGLFAKGIPCFRGAYHVPAVLRWPAVSSSTAYAGPTSAPCRRPTW